MGIASTPAAGSDDAEEEQSKIPSKRRGLEFLDVPITAWIRKMNQMQNKRGIIMLDYPSKKDYTSKVGKYKKVKE